MRKQIVAAKVPAPAGTYSTAIRANGFVFISGQTPRRLDGSRPAGASFHTQARLTLDNLECIANAAGLSLRDAVKVDVFLKDLSHKAVFDSIYAAYVGLEAPTRTLVQSNFGDFELEVSAILLDRG